MKETGSQEEGGSARDREMQMQWQEEKTNNSWGNFKKDGKRQTDESKYGLLLDINPLHNEEAPQRLNKGAMDPSKTSTPPSLMRTQRLGQSKTHKPHKPPTTFMLKRRPHLERSSNLWHTYTPASSLWRNYWKHTCGNMQRPLSNTVCTQQNELHTDFFHVMPGVSFNVLIYSFVHI